jgi:predicted AlkP superfamily phosphohydrolase/phosphomutase
VPGTTAKLAKPGTSYNPPLMSERTSSDRTWLRLLLWSLPLAVALAGGGWLAARSVDVAPPARPRPLVVVGIDGAEWDVVRQLWDEGKLPHLRAIADRGVTEVLRTRYGSSPVIWTTIATGRSSRAHGITGFTVPTATGEAPVGSTLRRVPALWNMASTAGLRVHVVSWWASWPAEQVSGVVVSDRALLDVQDAVSPAQFSSRFTALREAALARPNLFGGNPQAAERDQVTTEAARELVAAGDFDLAMVYFRAVDVASHNFWRYFRPEGFPPPDPAMMAAHGNEVVDTYEATDAAIGALVAAAPDANFVVVSDHGFRALPEEEAIVTIDFDQVLERLGYLVRRPNGEADVAKSRIYGNGSRQVSRVKKLRFSLAGREPGGTVAPRDREAVLAALEKDLARVTWEHGRPAFRLRPPRNKVEAQGADLWVAVIPDQPSLVLLLDGQPWKGVVEDVTAISGSHSEHTHGIFLAAGPDIDPAAAIEGIEIHDIASTLLYGLGLPVADDADGRAWPELFTAEFRRRDPLRTISTWGKPRQAGAAAHGADEEVLRDLRALGYLN